ncbi:hypothetical protein [Herminiimonas sp. CN]|uniref:hypothetical protein n=1 Tax=Herminiimonas sp. CN TaxID=1349818 RepID=UPI000474143B|nr:hypothetical protein [Herminiimonas sp. CN]
MKKQLQGAIIVLAFAAAATASGTALAQSAGVWLLKAGVNQITPKVKSGDMSAPALPGTKADVRSDT